MSKLIREVFEPKPLRNALTDSVKARNRWHIVLVNSIDSPTLNPSNETSTSPSAPSLLAALLPKAITRRDALLQRGRTQAFRIFSGDADGIDGIYIDIYGPGAVLIDYEGRTPRAFNAAHEASIALDLLRPLGVRAIYHKPFSKDRSAMGGVLPACVTDPAPITGETLPESVIIREHGWNLEIRLFDGLSTGLFLDQRENRAFVARWVTERIESGKPASVLNTFAYTCAFSVAAAKQGATTTSVDVSARYLDWGKRNFEHNQIDIAPHRFAKMDTFDFLGYAKRKGFTYDLIVLDPPSFAAGSPRKGIRPWSSVADYAKLVREAAGVLAPKGLIFASTNTQELCRPGRLEREVVKGLGKTPHWVELPKMPADFASERERFSALAWHV